MRSIKLIQKISTRPNHEIISFRREFELVVFRQESQERLRVVRIENRRIAPRANFVTLYSDLRCTVVTIELRRDLFQCLPLKHQPSLTPRGHLSDVDRHGLLKRSV